MRMRLFYAAVAAFIFVTTSLAGNFSNAASPSPPVMQISSTAKLFNASRSPAAVSAGANIQAELDRFLDLRKPAAKRDWGVLQSGKIEFDKDRWTATKDEEGSEVFVLKKPAESTEIKRTVIRNDDNSIRTISEYQIVNDKENYWFVFFLDQKLSAATTCTDRTSDGLRSCTTAIPSVCKSLSASQSGEWSLPKEVVPDVDLVEKRALATVLSMRGEGHQLANMAKTGNLIGLKHKLQTTRGRLTTTPVKSQFTQEAKQLCSRLSFDL